MDYKIAVLLTCFNRREKTIKALSSLFAARDKYNEQTNSISTSVFLTDDGCTDGTAEAALTNFPHEQITIVKSDGNAFWAGGMRLAWAAAAKASFEWDFYLLINDDAEFLPTAFDELLSTHQYALDKYCKGGVYTGFIADINDPLHVIYGAKTYKGRFLSRTYDMQPAGTPQPCMYTNANFLGVSKDAFEILGNLDENYRHGGADWDYGMRGCKAGVPVLTTSGICGLSVYDHDDEDTEKDKVVNMTSKERKAFLNKPLREYHDAFVFLWRFDKPKFFIMKIAYYLNLYTPRLYYSLSKLRP